MPDERPPLRVLGVPDDDLAEQGLAVPRAGVPLEPPPLSDFEREQLQRLKAAQLLEQLKGDLERGDLHPTIVAEKVGRGLRTLLQPENRFEAQWAPLPEDWLDSPPPPRRYLLRRDVDGVAKGALPRGRVGLLVGPGGVGKSWLMTQMAIAVAIGTARIPFLDTFTVDEPGPVVLAMAEEDTEELHRRVYYAARAMELSAHERRLLRDNLTILGLAGELVSFVELRDGTGVPTAAHREFLKLLTRDEHALVVLDPLARFAVDAESSNAIATAAVQLLEQLTQTPGEPTVIVSHHTAKWARRDGGKGEAHGARGVTGLTDGTRWTGTMELSKHGVRFQIPKSNYTSPAVTTPVELIRDENALGMLRTPTAAERAERTSSADQRVEREETAVDQMAERIVGALLTHRVSGREVSTRPELKALVRGTNSIKDRAITRLLVHGRLVGGRGEPYAVAYPDSSEVDA